jgi:calcium-dependent protein kinase
MIGDPYESKARFAIHRQTGAERVIKEVPKAQVLDLGDFIKKVRLIGSLDHPNVCRYIELFEDEFCFYFVSDYQAGQDLWDAVHGLFGSHSGYSEETAANIVRQILSAVNYLHKKGLIHKNIRCSNVLFSSKDKLEVKLIDYEHAGSKTISVMHQFGGGIYGP